MSPGPDHTRKLAEANATLPDAHRRWLAEREREKGNDYYHAHEYPAAVEAYTLSLGLHATAAAHANRAAAYLKLERWADAEADAGFALELQPRHAKALVRRGTARMHLGKTREAVEVRGGGIVGRGGMLVLRGWQSDTLASFGYLETALACDTTHLLSRCDSPRQPYLTQPPPRPTVCHLPWPRRTPCHLAWPRLTLCQSLISQSSLIPRT